MSPNDDVRLDSHLAHCSECALFYQEMVQATRLVYQLDEIRPRADFNARILAHLGLHRRFAWTKAAFVLIGSGLAAVVFAACSSLPAEILSRIATSVPALVRLYDKLTIVVSSLNSLLTPVVKISISELNPAIGLVFSILIVYFLGTALQKEAKCRT